SDVLAAEARADRERAFVRPTIGVDLGVDAFDDTLCSVPGCRPPMNLRGQLSVEVPLLNRRGPLIDREVALANVARTRVQAAHTTQAAALVAAYRIYEGATAAHDTFANAVVPAAREAAKSTEEAYSLGRAQLIAVLDAERALVDAKVLALQAEAARANAWIDVEHALGTP
ncbi:MAG: TolC family protein, partial [Polyangiaceae bacterium]